MSLLFGSGSLIESLVNPPQWWDYFKNGRTNEVNQDIANQNLDYQRERNAIEDARYEDERDYNRAFAEDERAYQRALQQQIFDREDTAIERQANQLSKLGINPLSQQMNGLDAGAPVSASVAPSASTRGGSALHNDFQMQDSGILSMVSPIMSLANSMSNLNTEGLQRDSLREQNDYQRLLNQEKALQNRFLENKLTQEEEARTEENRHKKNINPSEEKSAQASAERNQRENVFQEKYGVTDNSSTVARIATDATAQAERFMYGIGEASKQASDVSNSALKALANGAKQKIKDFSDSIKNAWNNDKQRFSRFKNWYKAHSYSGDELQKLYK